MSGNAQRALAREGSDGTLSFYVTGEPGKNFEDLCAGSHVPSTDKLKSFKLLSLAGAYWHGGQNSDQLTRVYGTCFADKEGDYRLRRVLRTNLFVHNRAVAGSTPKVCPRVR